MPTNPTHIFLGLIRANCKQAHLIYYMVDMSVNSFTLATKIVFQIRSYNMIINLVKLLNFSYLYI
jgi:hypothetical protein